ncbi:LysR family transcriptional regulator [Sorangium sp. So ce1335]|uniref:LysR family transcriptional regulator n=1 Tax=Sorangium sp. So ce1335 TaxID=3133335 RepID=UPI003F5F69A3
MENAGSPLWDDLRVLLALHRHRSLLAAGKALGISTSTAARRIDALEAALGRPLVHRSNGGTSVEPDALDLVALAEQIESRLRAIRRDEGEEAFSGTVRVSLADTIIQPTTKLLCDLRRLYPGLLLEILSEARLVDVARREADIAVRGSKSSSPAVVHRALGRVPLGLYAAPSYVERRLRAGRLKTADFERHDFVGYEGMPGQGTKMTWLEAHGARRFVLRSNSHFALLEAALQGQGIALMSEPTVRSTAGLVRIEVDAELPSVPIFLAYHRELRNVPRVRLVLDALDRAARDALR